MKYIFLLFPLFVFSQTTEIERLIRDINTDGFTGFQLYDSQKKQILVDYNADKLLIPASNVKILTFYESHKNLRDSIPTLYYYKKNDTLFIKPLGDPTVFYKNFSSENLSKLLGKNKNTIAVDLHFEESAHAPGWSMDDFDQDYLAERSVFPLFGNLMDEESEEFFNFDSLSTNRHPHKNIFTNLKSVSSPFIVSDSLILYLLKQNFSLRDVIAFPFPNNLKYNTLYSNPKKKVLQEMMLESDNFIAEQLALMVQNPPYTSTKSSGFKSLLNACHNTPRIEDGSGLSRYDLISPSCLVFVLEKIQNEIPEYLHYFPENGVSGTLENSYKTEKSYIYAKTGSMSGVYNLSGYIKCDSGKTLIFSILNNNFTQKSSILKAKMEKLFLYIKKNY